jgi:hypothetical protein
MPYIDKNLRRRVETAAGWLEGDVVETLCETIRALPDDKRDGAVNYVISTIVARSMKPKDGWRYNSLLRAYGTFCAAAAEFYRRLVAPYEDKAISKNGDIPEYAE